MGRGERGEQRGGGDWERKGGKERGEVKRGKEERGEEENGKEEKGERRGTKTRRGGGRKKEVEGEGGAACSPARPASFNYTS